MWKIKIIKDWREIWADEFQTKWNKLLITSTTSHVFFHPIVAKVWIDTYLPLRKMEPIFIWGEKDDNIAFLPLVLWHKNWKNAFWKSIIPVGYSDYDYHNPLFLNEVSREELVSFWSEVSELLMEFGADEICIDGITDSCSLSDDGWEQGEICPSLNISEMNGETDLMSFFGTKLRGDIRRQIRRLNELAPLEFKQYASSMDVSSEVFDAFMEAHHKKWPNAYKAPGFHQNLVNKCSLDGPIHFSTLNVGETVVAWHLGFDFNSIYYYYMPAGNPDYLKSSPVKVHLYYLICRAIERGYTKYDHLRGDETYKSGWADGSQYVHTLQQVLNSSSTKVKESVLRIKNIIKK